MKKNCIGVVLLTFITIGSFSQDKFYTKSGKVSFFSSTRMENIAAVNRSVVTLLNTKTGDFQFSLLMKGFEFKKAMMQEHFNRDFAESDKFPRAEFKGQVVNNSSVNYTVDGAYKVTVKGKLTIHGVTKDVETPGTLTVKNGKINANAVFNILLADYNISIPGMYRDNISKSIQVTVEETLEALKL